MKSSYVADPIAKKNLPLVEYFDQALNSLQEGPLFAVLPAEVKEAYCYPLMTSGKRLRPLIVLTMAQGFADSARPVALPFALSLELIHTYSLVHDDLPCMDDDDLRRGRPTAHKIYGEGKAVLIGDVLLTTAFELITSAEIPLPLELGQSLKLHLLGHLSRSAGAKGMIYGQWLDLSMAGGKHSLDWNMLQTIHSNKTGELLSASLILGFWSGIFSQPLSSEKILSFFRQYHSELDRKWKILGLDLGLSFQLKDDLLDQTQTAEQLGKTPGKDLSQKKLTGLSFFTTDELEAKANSLLDQSLVSLIDIFSFCADHGFPCHHGESLKTLLTALVKRQY